jgi:DNA polymerase III alpha subunit
VCYALGITEVDPARSALLFERFISKERGEPPDIDVDFEHERREEVIQYIYKKYGRERAALAAAVITYRTKGALRDAGRALGFGIAQINALTASLAWWDKREQLPERFRRTGPRPAGAARRKMAGDRRGAARLSPSSDAARRRLSSFRAGRWRGWCRSKMPRWPSAA